LIEETVKAGSCSKDKELEEFLEIEKQCHFGPKQFIFEESKADPAP